MITNRRRIKLGHQYVSFSRAAAIVVSIASTLLGTFCLAVDGGIMFFFLAIVPAALALLAGIYLVARMGQNTLIVLDEGFRVINRRANQTYQDESIVGITLTPPNQLLPSREPTRGKNVVLSIADEQGANERTLVRPAQPDDAEAFDVWVDHIQQSLLDRSRELLDNRNAINGPTWIMSTDRLEVATPSLIRKKRPPVSELHPEAFASEDQDEASSLGTSISLDDVSACESVDGHVCVWTHDEVDPLVRVSKADENSWLLEQLIHDVLRNRPDTERDNSQNDKSLGRYLFERRPPKGASIVALVASLILLILGLVLVLTGNRFGANVLLITGGAFVLSAVPLGVFAYFLQYRTFRFYENGVQDARLMKRSEIRFDEMDSLSWKADRITSHGVYVGMRVTLSFSSTTAGKNRLLVYRSPQLRDPDVDVENTRDRASRVIAREMARRLAAGTPVSWTPAHSLAPDAVEHRPVGLLKRAKPTEQIPYNSVTLYQFKDDRLYVWTNFQERSALNISTSDANFHPGFELFRRLVENHANG